MMFVVQHDVFHFSVCFEIESKDAIIFMNLVPLFCLFF